MTSFFWESGSLRGLIKQQKASSFFSRTPVSGVLGLGILFLSGGGGGLG